MQFKASLFRHEAPAADSIPIRVPSSVRFCLSEHAKDDTDGRPSMWRRYGGNGNGAAIVFDTAKIAARKEMFLVIRHVHYGTAQDSQLFPFVLGITLFAREKALVDDCKNTRYIINFFDESRGGQD
jgi:hypothetical protein